MNYLEVSEVRLTYKSKVKPSERPKVIDSRTSYEILLNAFDPETVELRESMKMLLLNRANRVLGIMDISDGGISETVTDVRLIMQCAILTNASAIILCHNHPSGDLIPSAQDAAATFKVKKACEIMNIELLDHIIITPESFYSFADEGRL
jgi:DNA repair protein RadC